MDPVLIAAESDQGGWSGCPDLTLVTAGWWLRYGYRSWLNLAKAQFLQPSLGNPLAPRTEVLKNWGRTRPRPNYSLCCLAKKGMQGISSHSRGMQTLVNHKNKTPVWYPLQTQQDLGGSGSGLRESFLRVNSFCVSRRSCAIEMWKKSVYFGRSSCWKLAPCSNLASNFGRAWRLATGSSLGLRKAGFGNVK